ncbi:ParB-like nuclease domain protein [Streptomyces phage Tomas]|uniref:ParB-like nuclease domain protein n=1 Tax=Streptomyces phage Tomas TaxID=2914443 RepID=A0AA49BUY9_9CAUD|nr:ParB-like nuclease domain [Streptomyces phage Tomas]YP_010651356.1 ParB-like nuclease domain [Streptomyces phage Tomas]UMO76209.1 ParB-like nuclease domain protein [Streptomyces phage Tomas]UMO76417.1 ParB-like nuclease domain protein [Streptomyces phage Tomas]
MRQMISIEYVLRNFEFMDAVITDQSRDECLSRKLRETLADEKFMASIRAHGIASPVGLDLDNKVFYNGAHRLMAAMSIGLTHIPYENISDEDIESFVASHARDEEFISKGFPPCNLGEQSA